jgi:hypothetical protein
MKYIFLLASLFAAPFAFCQEEEYKEPSKESSEYHSHRNDVSVPHYPSTKVKEAIKKYVKADGDDNQVMKEAAYKALSVKEKFIYAMIHPEAYNQICDAMPPIQDEHKKVFGQLPDGYADYGLSERQEKFLKDNKEAVIGFLKECIVKKNRVGINYKHVMVNINAVSMIPFLMEVYNKQKKDHDILTVLMLLMKNNKYDEFVKSTGYKKLYGEESNYLSNLALTKANTDLILKRASDFFNGYKK